ncbi:MAG: oligosaccharide flippase family protein [Sphingobacteriaceae bacterium]|jgi:O-antigen/teichoic acid export membrane protein|nr:MAG: hypothetical protein E6Q66_09725 [Pedobacter sp.]
MLKLFRALKNSPLFSNAAVYIFFNLIFNLVPFILMPILTRELPPADYGLVTMFGIFGNFILPFVSLNLFGSVAIKIHKSDDQDVDQYLWNCILIISTAAIIILLFCLCFSPLIHTYLGLGTMTIVIGVIMVFAQSIYQLQNAVHQAKSQSIRYAFIASIALIFNLILTLIFVVYLKWAGMGRIYAQALSMVLVTIIALWILIRTRSLKFSYNSVHIRNGLKFGLPLIPHSIGGMIFFITDRVIMNRFIGLSEVGVYSVAFQLCGGLTLIASSFNLAYAPWLYKQLKSNSDLQKKAIIKFTYLYFGGLFAIGALIYFSMLLVVPFFVGDKFISAIKYFPCLLVANIFGSMYFMVCNYIFYAEKTKYLALITFLSAILNIPLCYFLLQYYGTLGVVYSLIIINLLIFVATWFAAQKSYPMPWFDLAKNRIKVHK